MLSKGTLNVQEVLLDASLANVLLPPTSPKSHGHPRTKLAFFHGLFPLQSEKHLKKSPLVSCSPTAM